MEMVAQLLGTQDLPIFSRGIFSILDIATDLSCLIKLVSSILLNIKIVNMNHFVHNIKNIRN
jgi:hypothetical protein